MFGFQLKVLFKLNRDKKSVLRQTLGGTMSMPLKSCWLEWKLGHEAKWIEVEVKTNNEQVNDIINF